MTYCVGIRVTEGLVMLADTRTNAGVDNISRYRKLFTWQVQGERAIAIMTAGNLSVTQGIVSRLSSQIARAEDDPGLECILNAESVFRVAELVGEAMRAMQVRHRDALVAHRVAADASIIVGGQRQGGRHRLFLVYSAGNFIEATDDTPFLQIGEHQYGKPILDRVIVPATPLAEAVKAALVSMDSTLRSNLSVGMPLDLAVLPAGTYRFALERRIEANDPEFAVLSSGWSEALRAAFVHLPALQGV
ncbi:MAG TPA: peptidase [Paracoccaceae bacterium]|nr:peptidase [Paracoccaceae bacterium]